MSVPANGNMLLASEDGGYRISRSVRIRSSANAYFSRTPASASNRSTWTYSAWIKKAPIDFNTSMSLLSAGSFGSDLFTIQITDNGLAVPCVAVYGQISGSAVLNIAETPARRDPSAWFHVMVVLDTTQATASNRVKIYYNGAQVTALTTATYPNQNTTFAINNNQATAIGSRAGGGAPYYDGYMTEINFIDGQALTPTSFGAFDALTGVWNPIQYTGTYGTNGFYLKFDDTSAFGKDSSGNNNTWTSNNISNIAGTTYDSMVDSPTNYGSDTGAGGEVRGNYCILSPIDNGNSNILLTNGNISVSSSTTWDRGVKGTLGVSSGKYYYEYTHGTVNAGSNPAADIGWTKYTSLVNSYTNGGAGSSDTYLVQGSNGNKNNGGTNTSYGSAFTTGDVEMCAIDLDNGKMYWGKNGTWFNSGNPASGTNAAYTGVSGTFLPLWYWGLSPGTSGVLISNINFGQRPFSYTAPSGFKALCTQNISVPTVLNGANYMAATLYTGTGASQTVSNAVNGISFAPDFVWAKGRSVAYSHGLYDTIRGATKKLSSNSSGAEVTDTQGLTAFNSNGFTLGTDAGTNQNAATYVGWQWKGGGAAVTNTAGSITSSVSANTTAGFSVVTYTGTGANATVGHGLGVAPSMVIVKNRSAAASWAVWHSSLTLGQNIFLDSTSAAYSEPTMWNSTAPTSTVFFLGTYGSGNTSSATYVAYCFAPIAGYSAFGSYTGNGSSDGPFIYTGCRPRFVLIRRTDSGPVNWFIWDTSRDTYNVAFREVYPDQPNGEATSTNSLDILSNGIKIRTSSPDRNASGGNYIYAIFAENPFTLARAR